MFKIKFSTSLLFSAILALSLSLTACKDEKPATDTKHLVFITSADNPPFSFFETTNGQLAMTGFEIDLSNKLAEEMGYTVESKDIDFSGIIPMLQSKRADFAMAAISVTDERKKNIDFSKEYFKAANVILTLKDSDFLKKTDYSNAKLGVQLGTVQEGLAKDWIQDKPGLTLLTLNKYPDLIQELLNKHIDAVLIEETTGSEFLERNNGKITSTPLLIEGSGYAIAFPKGSSHVEEFNKALDHLIETGFIEELKKKWIN